MTQTLPQGVEYLRILPEIVLVIFAVLLIFRAIEGVIGWNKRRAQQKLRGFEPVMETPTASSTPQ